MKSAILVVTIKGYITNVPVSGLILEPEFLYWQRNTWNIESKILESTICNHYVSLVIV
ncbi:MAG: hypothetical protein GY806_19590, partial [Gammaproteobacteria bacterium]|nr:hypothetical protein [Gammaproteobacteria bacterium]